MTTLERVLYTANAHTTSGRDGASHRLMAAWTSSFRLLEAPAPALAATQSNYSPPVGRHVSRRDKPATHSHVLSDRPVRDTYPSSNPCEGGAHEE